LNFPASPFWNFSLDVYGREGVAPACLHLQERHGLDVNVLMFCLWLGESGSEPDAAAFDAALAAVATWHAEVVRGLRSLRKRLKVPVGPIDLELRQALRARIQKIEIDAEHVEQVTLAASVPAPPEARPAASEAGAASALAWLERYFKKLGIALDASDRQAIAIILGACFVLPTDVLESLCAAGPRIAPVGASG
jgi:uncharacterized protein (TIGR02444 family)